LMKYVDGMLNPTLKLTASKPDPEAPHVNHTPLHCTASITDVVELGYALHANGFFNNGKASIKEVMDFLSNVLQKDLTNRRRLFFQIRERKGNATKYLDELKTDLIRYMDELDQQKAGEF